MCKHFIRPEGSIQDPSEIVVGDILYGVYGVYPIQSILEMQTLSAPVPFSEHPSYMPIHNSQADLLIFGCSYLKYRNINNTEFCSSWNCGKSQNSNFLFKNMFDAKSYRNQVCNEYDNDPDICREIDYDIAAERRQSMDEYFNDKSY